MSAKMLTDLLSFKIIVQKRLVIGSIVSLAVLAGFYQQKVYWTLIRHVVHRKPPKLEPGSNGFCPLMLEAHAMYEPAIGVQPEPFWREDVVRATTQASVLGSFLASLPAGAVADHCGGRWPAAGALALLSVCTLTLPAGGGGLLAGALCQGAGQAALLAGAVVLLAHWAPRSERCAFVGVVFAMRPFGAALGLLHLRLFRDLELGWTSVCCSAGLLGLVCAAAVLALVRDTPGRCACATEAERRFLWSETDVVNFSLEKTDPVPLKEMFSSPPFLSALLFQFGWSWVRVVLSSRLDTYLSHVLHLTRDLAEPALAAAALATGVSSATAGVACDRLVNGGAMSRTADRRLFGSAGAALAPAALLASVAAGCDGAAVCALFVAAAYAHGLADCSFGAVVLDLAPRRAGVSAAVFNCAHACAELFNWELFAAVCGDGADRAGWALFHLAGLALALACSAPFLLFGSAEVQPYNGGGAGPPGRLDGGAQAPVSSRDNEEEPTTEPTNSVLNSFFRRE